MSHQFQDDTLRPIKSNSNFNARIPVTQTMRSRRRPAPIGGKITGSDSPHSARTDMPGTHAPNAPSERARVAQSLLSGPVGDDEALQYDPDQLLDKVRAHLGLKNDAALARKLGVQAPVLSKIRHWRTPVSAAVLISMHEESGLAIRALRALMGDRRAQFSPLVLPR